MYLNHFTSYLFKTVIWEHLYVEIYKYIKLYGKDTTGGMWEGFFFKKVKCFHVILRRKKALLLHPKMNMQKYLSI